MNVDILKDDRDKDLSLENKLNSFSLDCFVDPYPEIFFKINEFGEFKLIKESVLFSCLQLD